MPSSGLMVFWFVLVVAFIPLCLWLLKRSGLAQGAFAMDQRLIKPLGQLHIGPGQRVVAVEVGTGDARMWLVLGVTAQSMATLHTMKPQDDLGMASATAPTGFASLLQRFAAPHTQQSPS